MNEQAIHELEQAKARASQDLAEAHEAAQRAAQRIPALSALVAALDQSLAYIKNGANGAAPAATTATDARPSLVPPYVTRPLTEVVLEIVTAAPRDIDVDDIMEAATARVPGANRATVLSHLSRFVERRVMRRTGTGRYQIVNRLPTAQDVVDQARSQ